MPVGESARAISSVALNQDVIWSHFYLSQICRYGLFTHWSKVLAHLGRAFELLWQIGMDGDQTRIDAVGHFLPILFRYFFLWNMTISLHVGPLVEGTQKWREWVISR